MSQPPTLPELHQSTLDHETLQSLFADLTSCAEVIAVIPKVAAGNVSPDTITLEEGQALFRAGQLRGLQVRYHYQGDEWWDTLIATPNGARITRIKQDYQE